MSSHLEQFINDHREEFDSEEPAPKVWDEVRKQLEPETKQETPVVRINFFRWSAAAAVVILLGSSIWYFSRNKNTDDSTTKPVAVSEKPSVDTSAVIKAPVAAVVDSPATQLATKGTEKQKEPHKTVAPANDEESNFKQETYYYAKLIEIKQSELKKLEKDEPLLYKKFSGDVHKLDSVYHSLQKQLPKNSNREEVLEAMIQNLQLQIGLLNHQLEIIKQINHSKKSEYEKAYKSA